ncbi:MAG TPA: hypothetical protein VFW53_00450 [Gallionella sp.]|nr:hypothetical protein [Gallionella sp.]
MRYVSSIPSSTYNGFGGREVKGLSGAHDLRSNMARGQTVPDGKAHEQHREAELHAWQEVWQEERRKACRRVNRQPLPLDLRSRVDRRHHNLLEGDVVEHIDEEV